MSTLFQYLCNMFHESKKNGSTENPILKLLTPLNIASIHITHARFAKSHNKSCFLELIRLSPLQKLLLPSTFVNIDINRLYIYIFVRMSSRYMDYCERQASRDVLEGPKVQLFLPNLGKKKLHPLFQLDNVQGDFDKPEGYVRLLDK